MNTPLDKALAKARKLIGQFNGTSGRHNSSTDYRDNPVQPTVRRYAHAEMAVVYRRPVGRYGNHNLWTDPRDCEVGDAVHENDFPMKAHGIGHDVLMPKRILNPYTAEARMDVISKIRFRAVTLPIMWEGGIRQETFYVRVE